MTSVGAGFTIATGGQRNASQLQSNFTDIRSVVNGGLDADNLSTATGQALALSQTGAVRRGKSIIATSESIAGTSYAALTTPDSVASIVVPTNGVLWVSFWCQMTKSVGGASETASVGLFLGANQARSRFGVAPASGVSGGLFETTVFSTFVPSASAAVFTDYVDSAMANLPSGSGAPADDTTNGHPVGAFVPIAVTAGTYTVQMRFKKTAGATVAVATRRLFVKAEAY